MKRSSLLSVNMRGGGRLRTRLRVRELQGEEQEDNGEEGGGEDD